MMQRESVLATPPADWMQRFLDTAARLDTPVAAYASSWPAAYREAAEPERAAQDAALLASRTTHRPAVVVETAGRPPGFWRVSLYVLERPVSLTQVLPGLQSLGLDVLDEQPFAVTRPDGVPCWIYDFRVRPPENAAARADVRQRVRDALSAIWEGHAETDPFNGLVVSSGLTWQEAALLRAYYGYLRQAGFPLGRAYVAAVLMDHPGLVQILMGLFTARFDPAGDRASAAVRAAGLAVDATARIDDIESLDADRVLRAYLALILGTVRTNYYRDSPAGDSVASALALKLHPKKLAELPMPRPRIEVFVAGPRVEGVHIRFGAVARGGLRWSDRPADFRTEILDLAKAQVAKNAIIVPAGAKGGYVVKRPPAPTGDPRADRTAYQDEGVACYRLFVGALLDVHDTLDPATRVPRHDPRVVAHDGNDPYLVVAADKGTATFSDIANAAAVDRGFWLGDAFASGGSLGYDHKAMAITSKGAWESVRRHFAELGLDVQTDLFTAVGIGDMSGDVFGNGMLQSSAIRLVAAFDHRHIFLDPDPDPATSVAERARVFQLPRSSWADYNPELISEGGGVFARTLKSVPISAQVRAALDLPHSTTSLTPGALIRAILTAPVDLLWNGGIGTYVKSGSESHPDAGDRSNDSVRVDAAAVRARVVGEGGNLGFTPRGRIEYARRGGRINTDALDNSAGVACSDLEVNIKIVLNALLDRGELTSAARAALLSSMTPQVSSLVLAENVNQNELLGIARRTAADSLSVHSRLLTRLEQTRGLDRELLSLPGDAAIRRLAQSGDGLTSPELATLIAQVKLALKADLLDGPLPGDDVLTGRLLRSFPRILADAYPETISGHPLRREIVASSVANEVVDFGGIAFVHGLHEDEAADATDAVRAFLIAVEVFGLRELWARIRDAGLPASISDELIIESTRVLARAARWLLRSRPQPLDVGRETGHFAAVRELGAQVPGWLRGEDRDALEERLQHVLQAGAPRELALAVHGLLDRFCLLDIAEISAITGFPAPTVAQLYYVLKDRYRINRLLNAVSRLEHEDRWSALARLGLRNDLYSAVRTLCIDVLAVCGPEVTADEAVARWEEANKARLMRAAATLEETAETTDHTLATLSVAVRQINGLVSHSAPIPT
jgi:glutamate dehydrogenase